MEQYEFDKNVTGTDTRICYRCLLRDMQEQQDYHTMYEYIENLDEEIRTPKELYETRLTFCKSCAQLMNGMCRVCGCFVEMRAAVKKNYCPAPEQYW